MLDLDLLIALVTLPVLGFFFGGCPCCGCSVFTDDYSTDQLATAYSVRSGSWAVSVGKLRTDSSTALIVANTAMSASASAVYVRADITLPNTSDKARLVIAYVDDDNYWFAEVNPGFSDGNLKLYDRTAGTETQHSGTATISGFQAGETIGLELCYAAGAISAVAYNGSSIIGRVIHSTTITIGDTKCGMASSAGTGTHEFDNFLISRHKADGDSSCPTCPSNCPYCSDGISPSQLQVVLGGITDDECTACEEYNATYIVSQNAALELSPGGSCFWLYVDSEPPCDLDADTTAATATSVLVRFTRVLAPPASTGTITVQIGAGTTGGTSGGAQWSDTGVTADCHEWEDMAVTLTANPASQCNFLAATAEVSAL